GQPRPRRPPEFLQHRGLRHRRRLRHHRRRHRPPVGPRRLPLALLRKTTEDTENTEGKKRKVKEKPRGCNPWASFLLALLFFFPSVFSVSPVFPRPVRPV